MGWRPDATVRFPRDLDGAPPTSLPPCEPVLVAHNDLTPQNVVFRDGDAVAAIDFDLAGRTTALTDVVNTAMWWVPLLDPVDRDPVFAGLDTGRRLGAFLDAYGLAPDRRPALFAAASLRFGSSWTTMHWRAEHLGGGWARMWADGIGDAIARRVAWFDAAREELLAAVSG